MVVRTVNARGANGKSGQPDRRRRDEGVFKYSRGGPGERGEMGAGMMSIDGAPPSTGGKGTEGKTARSPRRCRCRCRQRKRKQTRRAQFGSANEGRGCCRWSRQLPPTASHFSSCGVYFPLSARYLTSLRRLYLHVHIPSEPLPQLLLRPLRQPLRQVRPRRHGQIHQPVRRPLRCRRRRVPK